MKRFLGIFLSAIALALFLAATSDGSGCAVVVRSYAPAYHTPYVAPAIVAVPVPVYSVTYGGNGESQQLRQLQGQIARLEAYIQGMAAGQRLPGQVPLKGVEPLPPPTPEKQQGAAFSGFLRADCAKCHTAGSEKGKFTLFNKDGAVALNPEQLGDAIIAVNGTFDKDGKFVPPTMPKGVTVPAERRILYTAELTRIGAQAAAAPK